MSHSWFSTQAPATCWPLPVRVANDDARLRRAQALAPGTEIGLSIAAYLTKLKLSGEASVAAHQFGARGIARTIDSLASRVDDSSTLEQIRQLEASAANLYWSAWGDLDVTFVKKDMPRVPDNWLGFEGRRSAITPGSARNASDPVNAMLNYLYRLLGGGRAPGHAGRRAGPRSGRPSRRYQGSSGQLCA